MKTTAELMKFVLVLANENLMVMRDQLAGIREMADRMADAAEDPAREVETSADQT